MLFADVQSFIQRGRLHVSAGAGLRPHTSEVAAHRVVGADRRGNWSLMEYTAPPRFAGPPPHAHAQADEAYYVLEGNPVFQVGEQTIHARPEQLIVVERGTVHAFMNPGPGPARFLVLLSPAGYEGFWLGEDDCELVASNETVLV